MKKMEELGKVFTSDVLVIGGGMAGLPAAISAREKGADVLLVDKAYVGLAGQSSRGGNGMMALPKEADIEKYVAYITENTAKYLNDQDALRNYAKNIYPTIVKLKEWGVDLTTDENGELAFFDNPVGAWSQIGINLYATDNMRKTAVKKGVRIQNHTNVAALIKAEGRVVGAVGYDILDGSFYIFQAKTVVLACGACNFRAARMFTNSGEGNTMALDAGAQMRSGEFVFMEVAAAATGETVHGAQRFVFNKDGENVWDKYVHYDAQDVSGELILGIIEEYKSGRGPVYMDLDAMDDAFKVINASDEFIDGKRRVFPDKVSWMDRIVKRENEVFGGLGRKIPAKFTLHGNAGFIRVDQQFKTTVPGLYAVGLDTGNGSAITGAAPQPAGQRGGPFMYCTTTGRLGGENAAEEALAAGKLTEASGDDIEAMKEKIFSYSNKESGIDPRDIIAKIQDVALPIDVTIRKSGESLTKALHALKEIRTEMADMYAKDFHDLKLCHEAETMITSCEIMICSALERKESRSFHFREDYPETNNTDWLKWVIAEKKDGEIVTFTEDIPIQSYTYQPAVSPQNRN